MDKPTICVECKHMRIPTLSRMLRLYTDAVCMAEGAKYLSAVDGSTRQKPCFVRNYGKCPDFEAKGE